MLEKILDHLQKTKKIGNQWIACCPVHNDRQPSMYLKEDEGKVLIFCHACGAKGPDVVRALNLPVSLLFSDEYQGPGRAERLLTETKIEDDFMLALMEKARAKNELLSHSDYKRYKLALRRNQIRQDNY
ncbi:MAG: CHC2 zinc finger domain-containing protein [bacterium]